jgi:hypothetical protein
MGYGVLFFIIVGKSYVSVVLRPPMEPLPILRVIEE